MSNTIVGIKIPEILNPAEYDQTSEQTLQVCSDEFWHIATELFRDSISGHDMGRALGEYEPINFHAVLFSKTVEFIDKQAFPLLDTLSRFVAAQWETLTIESASPTDLRQIKKFFSELGAHHNDVAELILKLLFSNPHTSANCGRAVSLYKNDDRPEIKLLIEEIGYWSKQPLQGGHSRAKLHFKAALIALRNDDYSRVPEDMRPDLDLALRLWEQTEDKTQSFKQVIENIIDQIEQSIKLIAEQTAPAAKIAPAELSRILHDIEAEVINRTAPYNTSSSEMRDDQLSALKQDLVQKYPKKDVSNFLGFLKLIKNTSSNVQEMPAVLEEFIRFEAEACRILAEAAERSAKKLTAKQLGTIDGLRKRLHLSKTIEWTQVNWPGLGGTLRWMMPLEYKKIDEFLKSLSTQG